VGNETKWEYLRVMYERYGKAERKARGGLLDEFCVTTGTNRKYAIGLLNGPALEKEATQASALPFRIFGLDSDNGSEFIDWHLKRWCDHKQIQLTRGRLYKKNDNAHIEQKNWTHVRKLLGWDRYDSAAALAAVNAVYRQELRIWMNLYPLSVKLQKKVRVGSKLRRVYSPAQTPLERLLASGQADVRR